MIAVIAVDHAFGRYDPWGEAGLARSGGSSAFGDLVLVIREGAQDFILLTLGDLEEVERPPKLGRDFVELGR